LNIVAERWPAQDGNPWGYSKGLLRQEVGCICSHLSLIKHCKEQGYATVLILEDDAEFLPKFEFNFSERWRLAPKNWTQFYFGGNHTLTDPDARRAHPIPGSKYIIKCCYTLTTHAYALKAEVYDVIINALEPPDKVFNDSLRQSLDLYYAELQWKRLVNAYAFFPALITQADGFSDIQQTNVSYKGMIT
jgi:GR25 family glycosyltransferase involved in LPS biosynthesis